ncbi:hypothetical protein H721_01041 [Brucella ovis IntaBari-2006-46-332]|nr:hypothetical protein H720_01021 [Brucella ovis IntaBari-2006-46-348]ENT89058.1 hypothetical protein H721_01041 [Brucella ovis IntaBari-2006-46-332]ENT94869.1 hypothetical protein H715_01019 [Brucella ovis IntaBari-2002-82-58]ENT97072.1 hypothetical protein H716_01028 [Brucella ovis IntaBari-2001-319-5096]ENU00599.1 hypothetical protein H717_01094 [Brucella ovis IntaBari-2001-319-4082]
MVLQTDAELLWHYDHGLVGKAHAFGQRQRVCAHDIGSFVDFKVQPMSGPVWQARQLVIRSEPMPDKDGARRIIESGAGHTQPGGIEDSLLRFTLDGPDLREFLAWLRCA